MMLNCDIREFGAVGDGITLNTDQIQAAIDACAAAGGGRVTIAGGQYLSARIDMRSGVDLHIDVDGTLLASADGAVWKEIETDFWVTEMAPRRSTKCFIYAENCHDIAITGRGRIDCQGRNAVAPRDPDAPPTMWRYDRVKFDLPARMIFLIGCRDVICEDVLLYEPCSGWGYWICDCDRVTMRGIRVESDLNYPNADGIHINCSRDVRISDCSIQAGDDAIVIRAYTGVLKEKKPCERITVTNCNLSSYCACIRVSWVNDWIMRDCTFSNLTFHESNVGISITMPPYEPGVSSYTDEGGDYSLIERLNFHNIIMDRCYHEPIAILLSPGCQVNAVRDIRFSEIRANSGWMPILIGREDVPLDRIEFSGCRFQIGDMDLSRGPAISSNMWCTGSPYYPQFKYVRDLRMNDTSFTTN